MAVHGPGPVPTVSNHIRSNLIKKQRANVILTQKQKLSAIKYGKTWKSYCDHFPPRLKPTTTKEMMLSSHHHIENDSVFARVNFQL